MPNEIDGFNHSRTKHVGVPAIFGMNFQTVSTAEKLPSSDGPSGGYLPGGTTQGPLLVRALSYVNAKIGAMVAEIRADGLASSTRDHHLRRARSVTDRPERPGQGR